MRKKLITTICLTMASIIVCTMSLLSLTTAIALTDDSSEVTPVYNGAPVENVTEGGEYGRASRPVIAGAKYELEYPELEGKTWFEYVEYEPTPYTTFNSEDGNTQYRVFLPEDYGEACIMDATPYTPNEWQGQKSSAMDFITELDEDTFYSNITHGNLAVLASGGIVSGIAGAVSQFVVGENAVALLSNNAKYYSTQQYTGLSYDGFYSMDSMSITVDHSSGYSVAKKTSLGYDTSSSGNTKLELDVLWFQGEMDNTVSSGINYGVDIDYNENQGASEAVTRTFDKRTDPEVVNVPWRLVEYKANIPMRIEIYNKVVNDDSTIVFIKDEDEQFYYEQYLLQGICREWANGYIEHWNTGELVFRADFYEGFLTKNTVISNAKSKLQEGGK